MTAYAASAKEVPSSATLERSSSPCGACKIQRRKCTKDCVFAPYFPVDKQNKFMNIHDVFGARNVARLLIMLPAERRQEAVNSLVYEAEWWLRDPVNGCLRHIFDLQNWLRQLQEDIAAAKEVGLYSASNALDVGAIDLQPQLINAVEGPEATLPYPQKLNYYHWPMILNQMNAAAAAQLSTVTPYQQFAGPIMGMRTGSSHAERCGSQTLCWLMKEPEQAQLQVDELHNNHEPRGTHKHCSDIHI